MHGVAGERTLMRIYVNEIDRCGKRALYQAILDALRQHDVAGATVIASITSFGSRRVLHNEINEQVSLDRTVVVECVDDEARILAVLPVIDPMLVSGLVTLERANVIVYRAGGRAGGVSDDPPRAAEE